MDKDHTPQPSNDKQSDKKPAQQGGNLVWYMLGLGVLLLLMVTLFTTSKEPDIGWSDLLRLVEASDPLDNNAPKYIEIEDRSGTGNGKIRIGHLSDVEIGSTK